MIYLIYSKWFVHMSENKANENGVANLYASHFKMSPLFIQIKYL